MARLKMKIRSRVKAPDKAATTKGAREKTGSAPGGGASASGTGAKPTIKGPGGRRGGRSGGSQPTAGSLGGAEEIKRMRSGGDGGLGAEEIKAGAKRKSVTNTGASEGNPTAGADKAPPAANVDWKGISAEGKAELKGFANDGNWKGYQAKAKELGINEGEVLKAYKRQIYFNERDASKAASPASSAPDKGSVTSGAKEKGGTAGGSHRTFTEISKDWSDDVKTWYSDLVTRVVDGDKSASGLLFSGTSVSGGKNSFGMTNSEVIGALEYARKTGTPIKGFKPSAEPRTSGKASSGEASSGKASSGSFDPYAVEDAEASFSWRPNTPEVFRRTGRGPTAWTPGGLVAATANKLHGAATGKKLSPAARGRFADAVNLPLVAVGAADAIGRSIENAGGTTVADKQDWAGVEYLNPLMWGAYITDKAAKVAGPVGVPAGLTDADMTDYYHRTVQAQEQEKKMFDAALGRAQSPMVSAREFDGVLNAVRGKYNADMVAASRLPADSIVRLNAETAARTKAVSRLRGLEASGRMKAHYDVADLAAVNAMFEKEGGDPVDSFETLSLDYTSEELKPFKDRADKVIEERRGMVDPLDRLGW